MAKSHKQSSSSKKRKPAEESEDEFQEVFDSDSDDGNDQEDDSSAVYLQQDEDDEDDDYENEARALRQMMKEGKFGDMDMDNDEEGGSDEEEDENDQEGSEEEEEGSSEEEESSEEVSKVPLYDIKAEVKKASKFPTPPTAAMTNTLSKKALQAASDSLTERQLPWAERLDCTSKSDFRDIDPTDDLKREVGFYNMALEAVRSGREGFANVGMKFTRPMDFFAEMLKSDEHMAKIKDRLIFENKKISAFEQRKSNKDASVRAKEIKENKLKEKHADKKDNLDKVAKWAEEAKGDRLKGIKDDDDAKRMEKVGFNDKRNFKREKADSKYGYGGNHKAGKFKKNMTSKELNDFSGYNPKGNFKDGMKSTRGKGGGFERKGGGGSKGKSKGGAGADRQGKRARDSKRQKR